MSIPREHKLLLILCSFQNEKEMPSSYQQSVPETVVISGKDSPDTADFPYWALNLKIDSDTETGQGITAFYLDSSPHPPDDPLLIYLIL